MSSPRPFSPRRPAPDPEQIDRPPSKTARKAAMHALQSLGEQLVALPSERLERLPIDDTLREALREFGRVTTHEAKRRQMQYIGRLMRDVDPAPIAEAIAAFTGTSRAANARLHRLEDLRERLLVDETVLAEFAAEHAGADLQRLRQLRRNALRERETGAPPRAFRALFQLLKEQSEPTGEEQP